VSSLELRRDIVVLACAISAGIHGALVPDHFEEGTGAGLGFVVATALLAGLLVALSLADRPSRSRYALAVCGVVMTLPNLQLPTWHSTVPQASFAVPQDATTLVLPYGPAGWSMLWQAEAHFRYRLVGGAFTVRVVPQERDWRDVYTGLGAGRVTPRRLRAFLAAHGVSRIVVAPGTRRGALRLVRAVCGSGRPTGGTSVYEVGHFGGCTEASRGGGMAVGHHGAGP